MYTETESKPGNGIKTFFLILILSILCMIMSGVLSALVSGYKIFTELASIAVFCVIAYFAINRCGSSYVYSLSESEIILHKSTGILRESKITVNINDTEHITRYGRVKHINAAKQKTVMLQDMFIKDDAIAIVYKNGNTDCMAVFCPSEAFTAKLKESSWNVKAFDL